MSKNIPHPSLAGMFDVRTPMAELPPSSYRFRENFMSPDVKKVCRMPGFEKLLSRGSNYGNMDLHDQLLPLQTYYNSKNPPASGADDITSWPDSTHCRSELLTHDQVRERITFQFQFISVGGARKLIACTQSRVYLTNLNTRNWRLLGDGFGGTPDPTLKTRFSAAVLNDIAVFTNDVDYVQYWPMNGGPTGCSMNSLRPIQSLIDIGVTSAAVVVEFHGVIMLMNVVQDGQRYGTRILTSDFNNATSFDPANTESITSFTTLPNSEGEQILNAAQLGDDQLIVYTDNGIYLGGATGNADNPFEFVKHYTPGDNDNRCLHFKNTLVNTGVSHIYMGRDSVYTFTPYRRDPSMVDWIHNASGVIYDGITGYPAINAENCESHVGGYDAGRREVWFSWATGSDSVPSRSMTLNMDTEFVSTVEIGFTSFTNFQPDSRPLFRDWLLSNCSCSIDELGDLGLGFIKEGQPTSDLCDGDSPTSIWTNNAGSTFGIPSEDWTKFEADGGSLCAALGGATLDDFCRECKPDSIFIGAFSDDWCLKQIGTAYSREICLNADTPTGPDTPYENVNGVYSSFAGTYEFVGYFSVIRSGAINYNSLDVEKHIDRIYLELDAIEQANPCVISLKVGTSFTARDPNDPACGIIWSPPVNRYFKCPLRKTIAQYVAQNLRPSAGTEFPFFRTGVYLYWELTIASLEDQDDLTSDLVPGIGGSGCLGLLSSAIRTDSPVDK